MCTCSISNVRGDDVLDVAPRDEGVTPYAATKVAPYPAGEAPVTLPTDVAGRPPRSVLRRLRYPGHGEHLPWRRRGSYQTMVSVCISLDVAIACLPIRALIAFADFNTGTRLACGNRMAEHEITPEERERFEKEVLKHEDKDSGGPASEPQIRDERQKPQGSVLPPTPD